MALPTSPHLKSLPAKGTATAAAPSGKQYATADDLASTAVSSAAWDSSQSQEVVKGAVVDLSGVSPRKDEGGMSQQHGAGTGLLPAVTRAAPSMTIVFGGHDWHFFPLSSVSSGR